MGNTLSCATGSLKPSKPDLSQPVPKKTRDHLPPPPPPPPPPPVGLQEEKEEAPPLPEKAPLLADRNGVTHEKLTSLLDVKIITGKNENTGKNYPKTIIAIALVYLLFFYLSYLKVIPSEDRKLAWKRRERVTMFTRKLRMF